jgi:hypothetical protein
VADSVLFKYRAFLSYSNADTGWGKWVHSRLEAFHIDKDLVGRGHAARIGTMNAAVDLSRPRGVFRRQRADRCHFPQRSPVTSDDI